MVDYIYTLNGKGLALSGSLLGGIRPRPFRVTVQGNSSEGHVTTACLRVFDSSWTQVSSLTSVGEPLVADVPSGYFIEASAKAPDYWSAARFATDLPDFVQGSSTDDSHSISGSGIATQDASISVADSDVGPRGFTAGAFMHIPLMPTVAGAYRSTVEVACPYSIVAYTGDPSIIASSTYEYYHGAYSWTASAYRYSTGTADTLPVIVPGSVIKNCFMSANPGHASLAVRRPYAFVDDGKGSGRLRPGSVMSYTEWTEADGTAVLWYFSGSASAASITAASSYTSSAYFGFSARVRPNQNEWVQNYQYLHLTTVDGTITPTVYISGVSK